MATSELNIIDDCNLNGVELRNSTIRNCVLQYVQIHRCTIQNSTLNNCQTFNSTIQHCKVIDSKPHETKIRKCSLQKCLTTWSPLALRKFPPEIRELIFYKTLQIGPAPQLLTPPVLIALRGDKELYNEGLRIFYRSNMFELHSKNYCVCEALSTCCLENLRSLMIWVPNLAHVMLPKPLIVHVSKLTLLSIYGTSTINELKNWAKLCFTDFRSIRHFVAGCAYNKSPTLKQRRHKNEVTEELNRSLGCTGDLNRIEGGSHTAMLTWFAEAGEVLKWKDD